MTDDASGGRDAAATDGTRSDTAGRDEQESDAEVGRDGVSAGPELTTEARADHYVVQWSTNRSVGAALDATVTALHDQSDAATPAVAARGENQSSKTELTVDTDGRHPVSDEMDGVITGYAATDDCLVRVRPEYYAAGNRVRVETTSEPAVVAAVRESVEQRTVTGADRESIRSAAESVDHPCRSCRPSSDRRDDDRVTGRAAE